MRSGHLSSLRSISGENVARRSQYSNFVFHEPRLRFSTSAVGTRSTHLADEPFGEHVDGGNKYAANTPPCSARIPPTINAQSAHRQNFRREGEDWCDIGPRGCDFLRRTGS